MQVVRMIQGGVDVDNTGSASLDANRIYMFGQSSGGIIGTVFMVLSPISRLVFQPFPADLPWMHPDGPGPLFEVPIAGPLPEDLAFIP